MLTLSQAKGMNDNASGVAALLEVADRLTYYTTRNVVKFCFWAAEELSLWGSYLHLHNLSPTERDRIMAYLNFDMLASPNYAYGVLSSYGKMRTPPSVYQPEDNGEPSRKADPMGSEDI